MRLSVAGFFIFLAACAGGRRRDLDPAAVGPNPADRVRGAEVSEVPPQDSKTEMPFIKLARRDLALVVYFAAGELTPGAQEDIERRIAARLRTTYRTPVRSY